MTNDEISLIKEIQNLFRSGTACFKDHNATPEMIKSCRKSIENAMSIIQIRKPELSETAIKGANEAGLNLALASIINLQDFPEKKDREKHESCLKVAINLGDDEIKHFSKFLLAESYFEKGKRRLNSLSSTKILKEFLALADDLVPDHEEVIPKESYNKFIDAMNLVRETLLLRSPDFPKRIADLAKKFAE